MPTRRTVLGSLAGGVAGFGGCVESTGQGSTDTRPEQTAGRTPTDSPPESETPQPTETPAQPRRLADAPVDLGLSLRYATTSPAENPRIEAPRTRAGEFDVVRIDGRHYRPTEGWIRGLMVCRVEPTYHHFVSTTETPLRPREIPAEVTITEASDLPSAGQSLFDRVVAADGTQLSVARSRHRLVNLPVDVPSNTTDESTSRQDGHNSSNDESDSMAALFGGQRARYVRDGDRIHWVEQWIEARPPCADANPRTLLELEPTDGTPQPDEDVLQAVPLSAGTAQRLTDALSSWVATGPGQPPASVQAFVESGPHPTSRGLVDLTLTTTDGGYRLAAVRLPNRSPTWSGLR